MSPVKQQTDTNTDTPTVKIATDLYRHTQKRKKKLYDFDTLHFCLILRWQRQVSLDHRLVHSIEGGPIDEAAYDDPEYGVSFVWAWIEAEIVKV